VVAPNHEDVRYLRTKAGEFRDLADRYSTPISSKLRKVADQLEAHAEELEMQLSKRR
jgi:hypothetical protein